MRITIDPTTGVRVLADRLAIEKDPILRRNLATVLKHQRCELEGEFDLEGLMTTMIAEPIFHIYEVAEHKGGPASDLTVQGCQAVRHMYQERRDMDFFSLVEFDIQHLVVDQRCIGVSGIFKAGHQGAELLKMGYDVDDPEAFYLYLAQHAEFYPFDESGLMVGEDIYFPAVGYQGIETRKITRNPGGKGGFVDIP